MGSRPILPEFRPVTISTMLNFIGPNIGVSVCVKKALGVRFPAYFLLPLQILGPNRSCG